MWVDAAGSGDTSAWHGRISGGPRKSGVIPAIRCCCGIAIPEEDVCQLLRSAHT